MLASPHSIAAGSNSAAGVVWTGEQCSFTLRNRSAATRKAHHFKRGHAITM